MVFSRFILTIPDMEIRGGLQGVTEGYKELQAVTRGYKGYRVLQGVTGGYKGLQEVTRRYRELQRIIESFF